VEQRANEVNISLRTGCFAIRRRRTGPRHLSRRAERLLCSFHRAADLDEFRRCIDDKSTGAVRISVGLVTTLRMCTASFNLRRVLWTIPERSGLKRSERSRLNIRDARDTEYEAIRTVTLSAYEEYAAFVPPEILGVPAEHAGHA